MGEAFRRDGGSEARVMWPVGRRVRAVGFGWPCRDLCREPGQDPEGSAGGRPSTVGIEVQTEPLSCPTTERGDEHHELAI